MQDLGTLHDSRAKQNFFDHHPLPIYLLFGAIAALLLIGTAL